MSLNLPETDRILRSVEQSVVPESLRRHWLEAAVRYAGIRVAWWRAPGPETGAIRDFACLLHAVLGLRAR